MEKVPTFEAKYDYDPSMFNAEPPDNVKFIKSLYVGRTKELKRGTSIFKKYSDVSGRRAKRYDKRPWVIHGESRIGKSHLARRILVELPKSRKKICFIIPARERLEAVQVMKQLFENLKEEYYTRINDQNLREDILGEASIVAVSEIIDRISSFPIGAESVTLTFSESTKSAIESGAEIGIVPQIFKFIAKLRAEHKVGTSLSAEIRSPTPQDYAEYCALMIDALISLGLVNHVCVLVDDVDLLEGYKDATQNGRIQRSILSDALTVFHKTHGVDVILTARSWYAHSRKEFQTLIDLTLADSLSIEELIRLHNRRYEILCPKGLTKKFLSDTALENAAKDVQGMPGVFLQHLDTAFQVYLDEDEGGERDYDWYFAVFLSRYNRFRIKCPAAAAAIEEAVARGELIVDVSQRNPFHQTIFDNDFVFQSYYQETTYFMDSLVHKIVENRNAVV